MRKYDERFEEYMLGHTSEESRWMHVAGFVAAMGAAAVATRRRRAKLLWAVPGFFFSFAWSGHFIFERNLPVGFTDPSAAFSGDLKMIFMMMSGKNAELNDLVERLQLERAQADNDPLDAADLSRTF